ncbi:NAD(P)-binding protein [Neocallimastix californiae]|uniref:Arsenite methyltransferase n=1 Tax=Neocallimastix californiae TaxID=1754190 RepID=A0A1Y2D6X2_9FUNG|nr:NAD(P)-binding protein [Neocallimastix californiae]|eukprot:ORY54904.1 NAD(P)-binding protein [Neocallimastix californiae]
MINPDQVRENVSKTYSQYATAPSTCVKCCSCKAKKYAEGLGYTKEDLQDADATVGSLSCGNPVGIADIKEGETVLDLGCGGGFDCRLAARKVGPTGKVYGVDMTEEMIQLATKSTKPEVFPQVKFIQGQIEEVASIDGFLNSFDVVISNCVFNLSPEKQKTNFSDPVALKPIPEATRKDMSSYTSCMANATLVDELSQMLSSAGFENIRIEVKNDSSNYVNKWTPEIILLGIKYIYYIYYLLKIIIYQMFIKNFKNDSLSSMKQLFDEKIMIQ